MEEQNSWSRTGPGMGVGRSEMVIRNFVYFMLFPWARPVLSSWLFTKEKQTGTTPESFTLLLGCIHKLSGTYTHLILFFFSIVMLLVIEHLVHVELFQKSKSMLNTYSIYFLSWDFTGSRQTYLDPGNAFMRDGVHLHLGGQGGRRSCVSSFHFS